MDVKEQLSALLGKALSDAGVDLKEQLGELVAYSEQRVNHLQTMAGSPDFHEAVIIERDNILLKTAELATVQADDFDTKIIGIIQGAITILAIV